MTNRTVTYRYIRKQNLNFCLLLLCLLVMTGCGNLYTGDETIFDPDRDETIKEESVPVMVAFDDPYYNILSRGVGKIDPEDEWFSDKMNPLKEDGTQDKEKEPRFFVYAFCNPNPYGYDVTRQDDKEICLVDGSNEMQQVDCEKYPEKKLENHGRLVKYKGNGSFVDWEHPDDKLYYSDSKQLKAFDFFCYYYDDAVTGSVERTDEQISFPVKIDGSQDLMCGWAELTDEQKATIAAMEDEEERKICTDYHYCTYTGRRNIWPIIQMKHQLAYVKFYLKAGNDYGDPVRVHDMAYQIQTEGTFVVVAKNKDDIRFTPNKNGEKVYLPIRHLKDGSAITPEIWTERTLNNEYRLEYYSEEEVIENDGKLCPDPYPAGEMLIPPGEGVALKMTLSNNDTGHENPEVTEVFAEKEFEAGRIYNVNITVYGPKQISIEVIATPWKEGGDINVDIENRE